MCTKNPWDASFAAKMGRKMILSFPKLVSATIRGCTTISRFLQAFTKASATSEVSPFSNNLAWGHFSSLIAPQGRENEVNEMWGS